MRPEDFRSIISALGLNQTEAGILFGVSGRSVRFWIAGTIPIPLAVAKVLRLMDARRISVAEFRQTLP